MACSSLPSLPTATNACRARPRMWTSCPPCQSGTNSGCCSQRCSGVKNGTTVQVCAAAGMVLSALCMWQLQASAANFLTVTQQFIDTPPATVLDAACHATVMLGHGSKKEQQWPMHPPDPPPLLSPGAKMQAVPAGDMQGKQLPRSLQRHLQRVGGLTTRRPTSKLRASSTPVRRTTGAASQG